MLLSIIVIALLIKCKRRNLAGTLSAPQDIPPQPIEIPQESLLTDQVKLFYDDSANDTVNNYITDNNLRRTYRYMYHKIPRYHRMPVLFIFGIKFGRKGQNTLSK